jgi:hypothetical protein
MIREKVRTRVPQGRVGVGGSGQGAKGQGARSGLQHYPGPRAVYVSVSCCKKCPNEAYIAFPAAKSALLKGAVQHSTPRNYGAALMAAPLARKRGVTPQGCSWTSQDDTPWRTRWSV